VPGRRSSRNRPRLPVWSVAMRRPEGVPSTSIVAATGRCGQPWSEAGPPQTTATVCPAIPDGSRSADRLAREPAGSTPEVGPVEAACTAVVVRVAWPLADPHPALRRIPAKNTADAPRRSMLMRGAIYSRRHSRCALPRVMASTITLLRRNARVITRGLTGGRSRRRSVGRDDRAERDNRRGCG
jgi:hypothetical protein